ncbi:DUF4167 domain-containing protein [Ahrensia marina]|uniref:DUF4167 domain-containing protein n=1 Tax=Ahrensia marina TaxID=1514904 RepID=UPI0035D0C8B2
MRPGQSNKRGRGRGGRKGPSPLSRSYESNGPDVKIRGTAQHIADKYINLARDAQSSGDTVLSEAYFQHAEHFYRIVAAAQQQMNQPVNVKRADDPIDTEESNGREGFDPSDPDAPQPDANANGSGQNRDDNRRGRDDDDGDGERRSRRNRGRQRRGRGDESRGEESRGEESRGDDNRGGDARVEASQSEDRPNAEASADKATDDDKAPVAAEPNGADAGEPSADDRPRRAPRQRKARVDVADRFEGEDQQASGHSDDDAKPAPEAPKPVTLGDDVPPVQQAASDDT